jgi:hypothetical protein
METSPTGWLLKKPFLFEYLFVFTSPLEADEEAGVLCVNKPAVSNVPVKITELSKIDCFISLLMFFGAADSVYQFFLYQSTDP